MRRAAIGERTKIERPERPETDERMGRSPSTSGMTRREALRLCGGAVAGWSLAHRLATGAPEVERAGDDRSLDAALRLLHRQEPESRQGLSTHAPMVAEALCALGAFDRVAPWIDGYDRPILRLPAPSAPVDRRNWRAALGPDTKAASWEEANGRWADWKEFFVAELDGNRWEDVLDPWVGRLAPGMSGAATHGVIRTAHAARAMARRETPDRRAELARGLAYWASSYEELPSRPGTRARFDDFAAALAEVPLYWEAFGRRPDGRNIVEALRGVHTLDRFGAVRDLVAGADDPGVALSALTATFARVYLRHGTEHDAIAFVHAVTGPASLRRLAPHLSPGTVRAALPYAWQTAAAVFSAFARTRDFRRAEEARLTRDALAARAVENGDEHAIKFTEVMLAEHQVNPDPIYLAAAEDAVGRL
jgi:hypothetical protein